MSRYGDWASQPEVAHILADFLNNLGGTSWMNINSGYYDSSGNVGTSHVSHGGTCYDPYSHGKSLSDDDVLVSVMVFCHCTSAASGTALQPVQPVPLLSLSCQILAADLTSHFADWQLTDLEQKERCVEPAGGCEDLHRQWAAQEPQWGLLCHQQR